MLSCSAMCRTCLKTSVRSWVFIIHEQCLRAKVILEVGHESGRRDPNEFFGV